MDQASAGRLPAAIIEATSSRPIRTSPPIR